MLNWRDCRGSIAWNSRTSNRNRERSTTWMSGFVFEYRNHLFWRNLRNKDSKSTRIFYMNKSSTPWIQSSCLYVDEFPLLEGLQHLVRWNETWVELAWTDFTEELIQTNILNTSVELGLPLALENIVGLVKLRPRSPFCFGSSRLALDA